MQQSLIFTINLDSTVNQIVQNTSTNSNFLNSSVQFQFSSESDYYNFTPTNTLETNLHFSLSENQDKVTLAPTSNTVLFAFASNQSKIGAYSKPITFENNWP